MIIHKVRKLPTYVGRPSVGTSYYLTILNTDIIFWLGQSLDRDRKL